jgi:predicted dehydrogenase
MSLDRRKVRVGVVGCGVVASAYYLPYLQQHAELVAVCDLDERRTAACARLFGAREQYTDYGEMIRRADIEAVFILTGPGTHVPFALGAVEAGKHILVQKPMATEFADAQRIAQAVRNANVKAVIEPSSNSPLDPQYVEVRALVKQGALGQPYWFSLVGGAPETYDPSLGGNPYGGGAFYAADSGGMLFDFPYAPNQITTVLGSCRAVTGMAKISVPDAWIVPDSEYDRFIDNATDPADANYWDVVVDLPRTQAVRMEAEDNVFSLYEMVNGAIGVFHCARPRHPQPRGWGRGGLQVFGTDGNVFFGGQDFASVISAHRDLLPAVDEDGWYHIPALGDHTQAKWPKPTPGAFNYYHESTQHLLDCIVDDRDPIPNVEWGLHITEMMCGAIQASRTGTRYELTTTLPNDW